MRTWLLFWFFCSVSFSVAHPNLSKLRELFYNLEYFQRAMVDDHKASFSENYAQEQSEILQKEFQGLRQHILQYLFKELSARQQPFLQEITQELQQLPSADPMCHVLLNILQDLSLQIKSSFMTLRVTPFDRKYNQLQRSLQTITSLIATEKTRQIEHLRHIATGSRVANDTPSTGIPIYISFLWHMHQPIYWPYEDVVKTHDRGIYSYNILDIFSARQGPYTSWPVQAVNQGLDLAHFGVQISMSGSLLENLNSIAYRLPEFKNWSSVLRQGRELKTVLGHPRLDMVGSGFYHPVMPLLNYPDLREQLRRHKDIVNTNFGQGTSRGVFPPENVFADWMIEALADEGFAWVFVENIHLNRAVINYPWDRSEKIFPPNRAQQKNPPIGKWVSLSGLWAPSKVSAWSYRPHYVALRDPKTGQIVQTPDGKEAKIIVVPTARYMGNELGQVGLGRFDYERVFSQLEAVNNDPDHPILIVLHHDGDNNAANRYEYYHEEFAAFLDWARRHPQFVPITVEDYLAKFPVAEHDIVHVEPGGWLNADGGGPDFHKWLAPEDPVSGYSPDMNTWGTLTAASNYVHTAHQALPQDEKTKLAWDYLLVGETSCYSSWDGTEMWDSHATRAANKAVGLAKAVLEQGFSDRLPPTIFGPYRQPFNPGAFENRTDPEPNDIKIWSYVYDVSGLKTVNLHYRIPAGNWQIQSMKARYTPSETVPRPIVKAHEYSFTIYGLAQVELEYFIEAVDKLDNRAISRRERVYIDRAIALEHSLWEPEKPNSKQRIKIYAPDAGFLHWGVNNWVAPIEEYRPAGSFLWSDKKAVHTRLQGPDETGRYFAEIGSFTNPNQAVEEINFVFRFHNNLWGADRRILLNTK